MAKDLTVKDNTNIDFRCFFPEVEDSCSLLLGCRRLDYSASLIARAVEDCNATVLDLNIIKHPSDAYETVVYLRVNHRNPMAITRSLLRYGYEVIDVMADNSGDLATARDRANELLRYLEV